MGPKDSAERKVRADLETALLDSRFSATLGWIISLGRKLEGQLEIVHSLEADLQVVSSQESRQCFGWALLLYFTLEVCDNLK